MLAQQYESLLDKIPRRTNECWLGDIDGGEEAYVCGHEFLLHLQDTAIRIWQLLDGRRTLAEIVDLLAEGYGGASRDVILEDTIGFVLNLERFGLAAWQSRPLFEGVRLDD